MDFLDGEGGIIVPKSVRPIIDYKESYLGTKKGAKKQFRHGNLHIREFDDNYIIHMDRADPAKDPLGHLLLDAPEYLFSSLIGLKAAHQAICGAHHTKNDSRTVIKDLSGAFQAGTAAAIFSYGAICLIKQLNRGK